MNEADLKQIVRSAQGAVNSGYYTDREWIIVELHRRFKEEQRRADYLAKKVYHGADQQA